MIAFDPSEISHWAARPESTHQLPDLVRRLILSTVPLPSFLDMPSGSSGRLPGWDGRIQCECVSPWVPQGFSAWELSCRQDCARKANDDYRKRTDNPLGIDISNATFVFVTPHQWSGKKAWADKCNREGNWASVQTLDASNLASWLAASPAVASWFARLIGKFPDAGYVPLDEWWENWSMAAQPNISPDLVLAGREEKVNALAQWVKEQPSSRYLQGFTKEEAIAFLAAAAQSASDNWGATLMAKAIVMNNADAWRSLERHPTPLVLVRNFEGGIASQIAVRAGHHVLIPLDTSQDLKGYGHTLPKPDHDEMVRALTDMGLSTEYARLLTRQTVRRLPILRRFLIEDAGGPPPAWASPQVYSWLPPLMLIGQWDENTEGDQKIVSEVTRQPYEDIVRNIADLMLTSEPPLTAVGSLRRFACHEEAWHILAPRLTSIDIQQFADMAIRILGVNSTPFEMSSAEQAPAHIQGQAISHSRTIREGVARTLALIGTHPEQAKNIEDASHVASRAVSTILDDNKEGQAWAMLSLHLPTLAEAAPEAFLDAVENVLMEIPDTFANFFALEGNPPPFRETPPHTELLFALERLVWSESHFTRVAMILAHMAEIDPGGRISNRPTESLARLFRPWIRFTEASDNHRLTALETCLLVQYPKPAWRILVAVYPKGCESVINHEIPHWRPWGQDSVRQPTRGQRTAFIMELERLLLMHVGNDAERWMDLITILPSLSHGGRQSATTLLLEQVANLREHPTANELWAKLRFVLHHHRSHPDAAWDLSWDELEPLAMAYDSLTPSDPTVAYAWLFTHWPTLPESDEYERLSPDGQRKISEVRQSAIRSAYQNGGPDAILAIAKAADEPWLVGHSVTLVSKPAVSLDLALQYAGSESKNHRKLAQGILASMYEQDGWTAINKVLCHFKKAGAASQALADVYLATPSKQPAWERLINEETAVQAAYWKHLPISSTWDTLEQTTYAIRQFIKVNRSCDAADLRLCKDAPDEVVIEVLAALPYDLGTTVLDRLNSTMLKYNIRKLLEKLDRSENVSDACIAKLEIPLLPLLGERRHHLALHRQISRNPEFFADLIELLCKRADRQSEAVPDTEMMQNIGPFVLDILRNIRVCPGAMDDGTIDSKALSAWVSQAQRLCKERGREGIGNEYIGQMLANAPAGIDGVWPCEPVRDFLENLRSRDIMVGIKVKIRNDRGVTIRGLLDGGTQERSLAKKYREDAQSIARWPYTVQMLKDIASNYEREAAWHDQRSAEFDEFGH